MPALKSIVAQEISEFQDSNPDQEAGLYVIIQIPGLDFEVIIPADEFSLLTDRHVQALFYMFNNYSKSPELASALQHLENQNISVLELRMDGVAHLYDGRSMDFIPNEKGDEPAAVISYDSVDGDSLRVDIEAGTKVVITLNTDEAWKESAKDFIYILIHEIMHPVAPDIDRGAFAPDHLQVIAHANWAFEALFPGGDLSNVISIPTTEAEDSHDQYTASLIDAQIDFGFSEAEATAIALNLGSMFSQEYWWEWTNPVYVPEPKPMPPNVDGGW